MATLHGFTSHGIAAIRRYHSALQRHDAALVAHFDHAILRVNAGSCGHPKSVACVVEHRHREMFIATAPEHQPAIEVARYLTHEARHWQRDVYDRWFIFPHDCSDPHCSIRDEFLADPIYSWDLALAPRIEAALRADGLDPHLPWCAPPSRETGPSLVQGLAVAAVAALAVVVAVKLTEG